MKTLILMLLLVSTSAHAASSGSLECVIDPDQPIYRLSRKDADTFSLNVYFPNGSTLAPVFSGDVNVGMIPWIRAKADYVKKLGSSYLVDIPASQCIRKKDSREHYYIHCYIKKEFELNKVKLNSLSFYATSSTSTSYNKGSEPTVDQHTKVGIEIGVPIAVGTQLMDLGKTYSSSECRIDEDFWAN